MTLKSKLWLLLLASSLTSLLLMVAVMVITGEYFNRGYTHAKLSALGSELALRAEKSSDTSLPFVSWSDAFVAKHPDIALTWLEEDGTVIHATDGRTEEYGMNAFMNKFLKVPYNLWGDGEEDDIALLFDWMRDGRQHFLMLSMSNEALQGSQVYVYLRDDGQAFKLIIPLLLFILTPYVYGILFFRKLSRRLMMLNQAMKEMDVRQSVAEVNDGSRDEIGQLAQSFNELSTRIRSHVKQIQELDVKRQTLIASVSHDLRTPLTMIIGYAETLHARIVQPEEQQKYTASLLKRARYMDSLLQKLLEIAQLDKYRQQLCRQPFDLTEKLRLIVADYVQLLEEEHIELEVDILETPVVVSGDEQLIERAIRNLIENAVQYGGKGNYVAISLELSMETVDIAVTDRGPGIAEEKRELLFERFYRGTAGRGGEGFGLGLSIVREVAQAHNGRVVIESEPYNRTTFIFRLPREDV